MWLREVALRYDTGKGERDQITKDRLCEAKEFQPYQRSSQETFYVEEFPYADPQFRDSLEIENRELQVGEGRNWNKHQLGNLQKSSPQMGKAGGYW